MVFKYKLEICTNTYTGNFEREIVGYCIGVYHECEHGKSQAKIFSKETGYGHCDLYGESKYDKNPFVDLLDFYIDEHGDRFISIGPWGKHCNNIYIHLKEKPSDELIKLIKDRAKDYEEKGMYKGLKILGFNFISEEIVTTTTKLKVAI